MLSQKYEVAGATFDSKAPHVPDQLLRELIIYGSKEPIKPVKHNLKNNFHSFNGSQYLHEVAPFKGERYTLVFFKI